MSEPLRWSSITVPTPPIALAAASRSPALAWAGDDGELFWQPSPASEPVSVTRVGGAPRVLVLSATGDHVAWLNRGGAGWIAASGADPQHIPGTAGYGGVTFIDGHLLCAPSRAAVDILVVSTRSEDRRSIPLRRLDLKGLTTAFQDYGLGESAAMAALWTAILAGLTDARTIVFGKWSMRRRILGVSLASNSRSQVLLVYLPGGRLVRVRRRDGDWQRRELRPPRSWRFTESGDACLHPDGRHVAALLDAANDSGAGVAVFDVGTDEAAEAKVIATWKPRTPGHPLAFRSDGSLVMTSVEGGLDLWRIPGLAGEVRGSDTALACAGAHLASFALRSVHPADRPVAPSIDLLTRLWRVGIYPPLVWVHDLLELLNGGEVGVPPGMDPERAPEDYRHGLVRLAESAGLHRLRGIRPGRAALETTVARLMRALKPSAMNRDLRPPEGEAYLVREALLRSSGAEGTFEAGSLLPPGTVEAWEEAVAKLDFDELRTIDSLGDAGLGLPDCLADGFAVDVLPDAVRAVLSAMLRIFPSEVGKRSRHGHAASVTGFGGYGEIARKGNLDNLLPTEHAYPRQLLWGRLLQGEALYYGRESTPPSLHDSTWLVIDGSAAMIGDPLLLARAVGVAAARLAGRHVEFRFFDNALGPAQTIERPGDLWQLIHGPTRLPQNGDSLPTALPDTTDVWQGLLRSLKGRSEGDARVHIVIVSHEFLGAEEAETVINGLEEVSELADLRLVMIQFPAVESWFEPNPEKGLELWMTRGPSLIPERPPWKILQERGVPVALIPVTRLWGADD